MVSTEDAITMGGVEEEEDIGQLATRPSHLRSPSVTSANVQSPPFETRKNKMQLVLNSGPMPDGQSVTPRLDVSDNGQAFVTVGIPPTPTDSSSETGDNDDRALLELDGTEERAAREKERPSEEEIKPVDQLKARKPVKYIKRYTGKPAPRKTTPATKAPNASQISKPSSAKTLFNTISRPQTKERSKASTLTRKLSSLIIEVESYKISKFWDEALERDQEEQLQSRLILDDLGCEPIAPPIWETKDPQEWAKKRALQIIDDEATEVELRAYYEDEKAQKCAKFWEDVEKRKIRLENILARHSDAKILPTMEPVFVGSEAEVDEWRVRLQRAVTYQVAFESEAEEFGMKLAKEQGKKYTGFNGVWVMEPPLQPKVFDAGTPSTTQNVIVAELEAMMDELLVLFATGTGRVKTAHGFLESCKGAEREEVFAFCPRQELMKLKVGVFVKGHLQNMEPEGELRHYLTSVYLGDGYGDIGCSEAFELECGHSDHVSTTRFGSVWKVKPCEIPYSMKDTDDMLWEFH